MGWQDRDYARDETVGRPGRRVFQPPLLGGRSIVTILIVINVAVYVLGNLGPSIEKTIYGFGAMETRAVMHGQIWRLFTAQYLHGGVFHLLINMLVLHFLGRPLERLWSPKRFLTIYTLCGLAGYVFYTILGNSGVIHPETPAVGASGCIFGLLGIAAVLFPTATVYVYFLFPIKIRTAAYIFGAIALYSIIIRGSNYGGEACHLAGLGFGVWWAMKGEAWWAMRQVRMPRRRSASKGARPVGFKARVAERREDAETIDRILRKVYDGGIHSLSDREKKSLQEATERQQRRDKEAGRVDRL